MPTGRNLGADPALAKAEPVSRLGPSGFDPGEGHTPLPWGISHGFAPDLRSPPVDYVCGPDPKTIGIKICTPWVEGAWDNDPEANANAALIVRAVNAHYELLAALRSIADGDVPRPLGDRYRSDGAPSKVDKCVHGQYMYEDCGSCIEDFADSALARIEAGTDETAKLAQPEGREPVNSSNPSTHRRSDEDQGQ